MCTIVVHIRVRLYTNVYYSVNMIDIGLTLYSLENSAHQPKNSRATALDFFLSATFYQIRPPIDLKIKIIRQETIYSQIIHESMGRLTATLDHSCGRRSISRERNELIGDKTSVLPHSRVNLDIYTLVLPIVFKPSDVVRRY